MSVKNPNINPTARVHPHADLEETARVGHASVIDADVELEHFVRIGRYTQIHTGAKIREGVLVGDESRVGSYSTITGPSYIGNNVTVGPEVTIDSGAVIFNGAQVCPNKVKSVSSDGRSLAGSVTVGPHVLLHDEVELGFRAIVPTQRTIASLGNLGSKNRVITIYGSDAGPRYSIGCQIGEPFSSIKSNVEKAKHTSPGSAGTYAPYLSVMNEIGTIVQNAYDAESKLVSELLAERDLLGLGFDRNEQ